MVAHSLEVWGGLGSNPSKVTSIKLYYMKYSIFCWVLSCIVFILYIVHKEKLDMLRDLPHSLILSMIVANERKYCRLLMYLSIILCVLGFLVLIL